MKTNPPPTHHSLADLPTRVLNFLGGVSSTPPIRAQLAAHGYKPADHDEGWRLLQKVTTRIQALDVVVAPALPTAEAIAEVEEFSDLGFRRAHAALAHLHPEQDAFVFDGIEFGKGYEAILAVDLFLDRVDALESKKGSGRKGDHAAWRTLVERGFTKELSKHLRDRIAETKAVPAEVSAPLEKGADGNDGDRLALRAWYLDWSETAKTLIDSREQLIRLGLAKRRRPLKTKTPIPPPVGVLPSAGLSGNSVITNAVGTISGT